MGLGRVDEGIGLAEAREARDEARRLLRSGRNPIDARRDARAGFGEKTFGSVADAVLALKAKELNSTRNLDQWRLSLEKHAAAIRDKSVDDISTADVLELVAPLWSTKPSVAQRLRAHIETTLDAARARGLRAGENPARWRGHLSHLLAKPGAMSKRHHAALPYAELPDFMKRLRAVETASARALEFAILTAARSGEVYGACWPEIDVAAALWTIPPERMKSGREHRVPLSPRTVEILKIMADARESAFVFPGQKRGNPLSHVAMAKVLSRLNVEATPHGFRSSFRDWAGDETDFPREVAEAALAHVVGDAAEQAYRRGDALAKRRALMDAWAKFCGGSL